MHEKLYLDLELTVEQENVCWLNIPVDNFSAVQKFDRRRELSDALGGPRLVNDASLPTTSKKTDIVFTITATAGRLPACLSAQAGVTTTPGQRTCGVYIGLNVGPP